MRTATVERKTKETRIIATVNLDGDGSYEVATGIGFLDHMLEQLSRHSLIDLSLKAEGDLHIGVREASRGAQCRCGDGPDPGAFFAEGVAARALTREFPHAVRHR